MLLGQVTASKQAKKKKTRLDTVPFIANELMTHLVIAIQARDSRLELDGARSRLKWKPTVALEKKKTWVKQTHTQDLHSSFIYVVVSEWTRGGTDFTFTFHYKTHVSYEDGGKRGHVCWEKGKCQLLGDPEGNQSDILGGTLTFSLSVQTLAVSQLRGCILRRPHLRGQFCRNAVWRLSQLEGSSKCRPQMRPSPSKDADPELRHSR